MKQPNELATEAGRYERLSNPVGERELAKRYRAGASAIRKQLEVQSMMNTPQIETAMRRFLSDLRKAGIQVSEMESTVYSDKVSIEAR